MSNSPTFPGTITGGIQDISALLPLLGTEQCEKHVGSALDGGFLYSAATPLSIFGSLGVVRASFNILVASFNIPSYQFLGARLLHHSGLSLSGPIAPMIALDPKHPNRFLAETKLEAMLAEEHINNVPGLTVSWPEGTVRWNFMLVASTLVISSFGLLPYIGLIVDSGDTSPKLFFPLGLGFPVLRIFGSAVCVIIAQFLIQLRALIIMKTRLLFISIDRLAKLEKVQDMSSQINASLKRENGDKVWTTELAAEKSLWALQNWLSTRPDMEEGVNYRQVKALYTSEYTQHFGTTNTLILSCISVFLCCSLAVGCVSTVIGYVGCFFLVQHSENSKGPLLWLVLEVVLSIVRIFVWANNPSVDDSKGLEFKLQLSPNPSLLICQKTFEELLSPQRPTALITQRNLNVEQVVAFAGPHPTFSVQDVEIFFGVAINSRIQPSKTLLMVISTDKQQQNRLLVKKTVGNAFSIYNCTLSPLPGSSEYMALQIFHLRERNSDSLMSHSIFMAEVEAHYDKINFHLHNQETTAERTATFGRTWSLQQPLITTAYNSQPPIQAQVGTPSLTAGEKAYLDYHAAYEHWEGLNNTIDHWATNQVRVYNHGLFQTMLPPADQGATESRVVLFTHQQEAIEKAHLMVECQQLVERFLICIYAKWLNDLHLRHANMVEINLKPFLETKGELLPGTSNTGERHWISIHKHKLKAKFLTEQDYLSKNYALNRMGTARNRENETRQQIFHAAGLSSADNVQITQGLDNLRQERVRYYVHPLPNSHASFADVFQSPSNVAATFNNAVSVSGQYGILLQLQKTTFVEKMEHRLFDYPPGSDNKVEAMIDQVKARCRMRVHHLFDILMSSGVIDIKRIIDVPDLPATPQLVHILSQADHEWIEMVRQSEEALARMGTGFKAKRAAQIKITQYFVKHSARRQPSWNSRSSFESATTSSEDSLASFIPL